MYTKMSCIFTTSTLNINCYAHHMPFESRNYISSNLRVIFNGVSQFPMIISESRICTKIHRVQAADVAEDGLYQRSTVGPTEFFPLTCAAPTVCDSF
jgi:hypothetical protein